MSDQQDYKVYLAGPTVFLPKAQMVFETMKAILSDYELEGVAPVDNQHGLESVSPGPLLNTAIFRADVDLMNKVDAAIFDLSPFRRGTEMDTGTAFEIGYCFARKLPMSGWTTETSLYPEIVSRFFKEHFDTQLTNTSSNDTGGTSGSLRDLDGVLVHSEGMYQNIMVQKAIEEAGGLISANSDWKVAFRNAAIALSALLAKD